MEQGVLEHQVQDDGGVSTSEVSGDVVRNYHRDAGAKDM